MVGWSLVFFLEWDFKCHFGPSALVTSDAFDDLTLKRKLVQEEDKNFVGLLIFLCFFPGP
jgi:hypothetical protein